MAAEKLPQLAMIRFNMQQLPEMSLPSGYMCRSFQPGDEGHWETIINDSFGGTHDFKREMQEDPAFKPERVKFICCQDRPVATASAWQQPANSEAVGTLHMVGILKAHAGHGLGAQVCLASLWQMKMEERHFAVLTTDDFRVPAIKTYIRLGFMPRLNHESHQQRWNDILPQIRGEVVFDQPVSLIATWITEIIGTGEKPVTK
jgi:mycothiol synthase